MREFTLSITVDGENVICPMKFLAGSFADAVYKAWLGLCGQVVKVRGLE